MWHVCEEALAGGKDWAAPLKAYASGLLSAHPNSREQVQHWYDVCRTQFPVYAEYWAKNDHVVARTPLLQEQVFDVPYRLPGSGRTVRLRGKWDSVDLVGKGRAAAVYLQENKTKGEVDPVAVQTQLSNDMQTMMYLVALTTDESRLEAAYHGATSPGTPRYPVPPVAGVRYNVVRRPLSGGKGTIVRHKPTKKNPDGESREAYYARLGEVIREDPGYFFVRFQAEVGPADLRKFREHTLDPLLEQVCDWYEQQTMTQLAYRGLAAVRAGAGYVTPLNFRFPYGLTNMLLEGGTGDLDEFMNSGSVVGLERRTRLFEELR